MTVHPSTAARIAVRGDVNTAGEILPMYWPIETFIAVNPLGGYEYLPFDSALHHAGDAYGARGTLTDTAFRDAYYRGRITDDDLATALTQRYPGAADHPGAWLGPTRVSALDIVRGDLLHGVPAPAPTRLLHTLGELAAPAVADQVDSLTTKWCAAFFGAEHAGWPMPGVEDGFYPAWRRLAGRDRSLQATVRRRLRALPTRAEDAALDALSVLEVSEDRRVDYLRAHLTRMPGWASHVRWHGEHGSAIDLTGYLAMRLTYEAELLRAANSLIHPQAAPPRPAEEQPAAAQRRAATVAAQLAPGHPTTTEQRAAIAEVLAILPAAARRLLWQHAYEAHYRRALLTQLAGHPHRPPRGRPATQLVCCIDTRSEELRRQLEELGDHETLGFAGFFAVAIRYRALAAAATNDLCPVLITARNDVAEQPAHGAASAARRAVTGRRDLAAGEDAFHTAKDDTLAPFTLAEIAGWFAGPLAAAKTVAPGSHARARRRLHSWISPPAPMTLSVTEGFSTEERHLFAQAALTMMGLTSGFAPLIALCGHGSSTENNPYESALHCGACGGNRGGPNARTAAAILNDPAVRDHLTDKDIHIPADTWFVAAEHDTAHDTVTLLDKHLVPDTHRLAVDRLRADLADAGALAAARRCAALPGAPSPTTPRKAVAHVRARSVDWAQVYPEWGLVGNACFIIGPRSMTAGIDLGRRAFLHSYDPDVDPGGGALETILTAPLVVAQWINHQYYFSTVDPHVFGAGTKTIHNVIGTTGVLAGHTGDLRLGLPWQSVAVGERLVHEPMRLLAIVQAPLARIDAIIDRNPLLQHLFDNDWITLTARAHHTDPFQMRTPHGWLASPETEATTHD
ncbi:UPF0753 protein [Mycobacterium antarcticum]|uniref:DUF2309 domain-containing protein n=1 Tax=Mycolicibacterium sp. TUM20983 TaxID=3023369 RepID=UPI0023854399|nr:DUF2309 domain-containing protein [Mycolicibacterium sp. TUM20983]GLP76612.1 UPF0753 protein [Mycolicibacterium sp. TUM20983]